MPTITLTDLLAYPGAEGFGKNTAGGRGDEVYHVTNRLNSGPGSFRYGVETADVNTPRTIVFDVSGDIHIYDSQDSIAERLQLDPNQGNISILGQTAPEGGVTLRGASFWLSAPNQVIIRHLRIRPGDDWKPYPPEQDEGDDGLVIKNFGGTASNVMLDHLSISWGKDGAFDIGGNAASTLSNVSLTNCFIYEDLKSHYASLFSPVGNDGSGSTNNNFSFINNCFANASDRAPAFSQLGDAEHINNLAYYGAELGWVRADTRLNYIGNVNIHNPNEPKAYSWSIFLDSDQGNPYPNYPGTPAVYIEDSIDTNQQDNSFQPSGGLSPYVVGSKPHQGSGYTPISSSLVQDYVTANVGANLYRDSADTRVLNDINNLTGGIISDEAEVGGFPVIPENDRAGNYYQDSTHIAADFYAQHNLSGDGTNVTTNWTFGDTTVINNAGYTDREMFWAYLANDFGALEESTSGKIINLGDVKKGSPLLFGEGADVITGGRGQVKFFITTLSTASEATFYPANGTYEAHWRGSLRGAFSAGNRHIIPYIGGNYPGSLAQNGQSILLDGGFGNPDVNISYHGHLAPAGGFAMTNSHLTFSRAGNIILQYLSIAVHNDLTTGTNGEPAGVDCLYMNRCNKVALDHLSFRYNGDECFDYGVGTEGDDFLPLILQRCIFGQGADAHSRGILIGNTDTGGTEEVEMTLHNNFWCVDARTPNFAGSSQASAARVSNGVIYDWVGRTTRLQRNGSYDEINRYYIPGPTTITLDQGAFNQYHFVGDGTPSIYTHGNLVNNYVTTVRDNRNDIWSVFNTEGHDDTPLPDSYFRSTPMSIDPSVGYTPTSAEVGRESILVNNEVGSNRSTAQDGSTVFYHDSIDAYYLDAAVNLTDYRTPMASWVHPTRPTNTNHQTDTNWNGIYDGFETENNITSASEVKASYTWNGDTYLNPAGYDSFEVWSAIKAGAKDLLTSSPIDISDVIKRRKSANSFYINI